MKTPEPLTPNEESTLLRFLLRLAKTSDSEGIRRVAKSLYTLLAKVIYSR